MGLILLVVSFLGFQMTVDKQTVAVGMTWMNKELDRTVIAFKDIEEIKIMRDPNRNRALTLAVVSDSATLMFGQGGSKEELEWLQDRLLAETAKTAS